MPLVAALSLAATVGVAGEKCQKVVIHVGAVESGQCPPYDGPFPVPSDVPEGCIVMPVVGTLNGTWILYYWYSDQNPEYNMLVAKPPIWGSGNDVVVFYQLGVWKTKRGTIYSETSEVSHGSAIWQQPQPYAHFDHIIGGTGRFEGATGWISGAGDNDGALFGGRICTPRSGRHGKK